MDNRSAQGFSNGSRPTVKAEPPRAPSPTPTNITTVLPNRRVQRTALPTPSTSIASDFQGQITLRPLSSLLEQDDQTSILTSIKPAIVPPIPLCNRHTSEPKTNTLNRNFGSNPQEKEEDWRLSMTCVGDRLKYLLEKDTRYQDVTFEVQGAGPSEKFRVHSLVMQISSAKFDKMLREVDAERHSVVLHGVEPSTFKLLLKYIYTDEVGKTEGVTDVQLLALLHAATKYEIYDLYRKCSNILQREMSDAVAVKLCEALYRDETLLEAAMEHIAGGAFKIFTAEDLFHQLSEETLLKLLDRDDLRVDEITLFQSVLKWTKQKCTEKKLPISSTNLRNVANRLIPKIRFPIMRADEFSFTVTPTKILTAEEQVEIFQYLCVDPSARKNLPPSSFKTTPRRSKKCLELDSEDEEDTESENSDGLTANTECIDIASTDPESETASVITTYSDSCNTSNKRVKGSTSSGSSSNKRLKLDKSNRKMSTISKDELFGEPDRLQPSSSSKRSITLSKESISLAKFISDCQKNPHRNEIEEVELIDVIVDDLKNLGSRKVHFPKLKKFVMNIKVKIAESINSLIQSSDFSLEKLLFFNKFNKPWLYQDLWSMEVDIVIIINSVVVLKIVRPENIVTLNKFDGSVHILKSLKDEKMKSVVFSNTHYSTKHLPITLRRLVIMGAFQSDTNEHLENYRHLKELSCVPSLSLKLQWANDESRVLALSNNFLSKDKLQKLAVGNLKIQLSPSLKLSKTTGLYLWNTAWDQQFEDNFHNHFPAVQNVSFIRLQAGILRGSPQLLKKLLTKMTSLTTIYSCRCDWRLSMPGGKEAKELLTSCGVSDFDTFYIRKSGGGIWKSKNIDLKKHQSQHIYANFRYDLLYEDIEVFIKTS